MNISIVALACAIFLNSLASILIKKAGAQSAGLAMYLTPWFIGGGFLYGLGLIAYTAALKNIALSTAYPVLIGGSLVIIAVYTTLVLQEPLNSWRMIGIALIIIGVIFVTK